MHGGVGPEPATGAVVTPVYLTSTFVQHEVGHHAGFEYARTQNPSRLALER
ncbi:MAG: PLP-dependent transferase, partial [Acidimicrobiales bacterium]